MGVFKGFTLMLSPTGSRGLSCSTVGGARGPGARVPAPAGVKVILTVRSRRVRKVKVNR